MNGDKINMKYEENSVSAFTRCIAFAALGDQKLDDQEFEIFLEYQPVFEQWQKMSSQVGSIFQIFFFYVWR